MFLGNNLIAKTLANFSQFTILPDNLFNAKFLIWNQDIKENIEWDDFIKGQKVMHIDWQEKSFDAKIMLNSLSQGTSADTFAGMWRFNETMTLLVKDKPDFTNAIVTYGADTSKLFFAASYDISKTIGNEKYTAKIVLMELNAFLNQNFEESVIGYYSNIRVGKYGATIKLPKAKTDKFGKDIGYETTTAKNPIPKYVEYLIPEPAGFMGIDAINQNGAKWVDPVQNLAPHTFRHNPDGYCIVPTQFDLWSIDNYGISHPNDLTNAVKAITFTKDLSSVISKGSVLGSSEGGTKGAAIKAGAALISSGVSGASKFFGDARELSAETAISSRFLDGEGSLLKMFMQEATGISEFAASSITGVNDAFQTLQNKNAIANISGIIENGSTLPNADLIIPFAQSTGLQKDLAGGTRYNIVGSRSLINLSGNSQYKKNQIVPFLKAKYGTGSFAITDNDIKNYLSIGVPRRNVRSGKTLAPPHTPRTWTLGFRWNGFRPTPYTWMNWPILYPAQMGIYDTQNTGYSVGYNKTIKKGNNVVKNNTGYWTKGVSVSDITNKNFINPKDVIISGSINLDQASEKGILDKLDAMIITSSPIVVRTFLSEDDAKNGVAPINEYHFKSQGERTGTSANWFTRLEL